MCKARARDYAPRRTSASNYSLTGDHRQSANSTSSDISSSTIQQSQIDNNNRRHGQIQELVPAQPVQEEPPKRSIYNAKDRECVVENQKLIQWQCSIKKPKTHRYPSLKGTDPKFRRNHRHALHGTMRALKEVKEGKRDAA
ncbi:60s ribosomal protein l29 [Alternaria burnsii]|uniref:60S ribosomal protein L29 n=1 Tax=Alternaria burnsii TaxID=1187904 RepID=A0A8H7BLE9_9PLEO|nr:60s ribosomal protein l29 [Alternaria burnsii]KAF7681647.1 60s ribosomal protein l29 [Alternaria burnsii]